MNHVKNSHGKFTVKSVLCRDETNSIRLYHRMTTALHTATTQAQKWLPPLASAGLVLLIAYTLAQLLWTLWPSTTPTAIPNFPTNTLAPAASQTANAQTIDVQSTLRSGIFGQYTRTATTPVASKPTVADNNAPTTKLSLKLTGVIVLQPEEDSRAFIGSTTKQEIYAVGDALKNMRGVSLENIYHDRVILNHNGRLEALYIQKPKPNSQRRNTSRALNNTTASLGSKLNSLRTELLSNPQKASQLIRIAPAMKQGQLEGYSVYPGNDRKLFREIGLRSGDIITGVNGETLDDPAKGFAIISTLSNAQQIDLTIQRRGRTQNISVNLAQ